MRNASASAPPCCHENSSPLPAIVRDGMPMRAAAHYAGAIASWAAAALMKTLFQPVPFEAVVKRDGDGNNGSADKGDAL